MLVGQTLRQRYKIVEYLGNGSFGITYLAEDLDLPSNPPCVVKNLRQIYDNPEHLKRSRELFDREAKILYQLGNECNRIPKLFAHFEENGNFYLVQEFINGHDLSKEILPGKKWSEAEVTQLLQEILEVLTFIHNKDIIHRDIKPQNLMRRMTDGKIMLIDFGAVKQINESLGNSQGQASISFIIGTEGYMPSEQSNKLHKLSSDVYATGIVGIYALTGISPRDLPKDNDSGQVLWRNLVSVSPGLADVLDKMVRYHFSERYQTAAEALQALTSVVTTTAIQSSLLTSTLRKLGVNQTFLIIAGVGGGLLVGVGLLFMSFWRQPATDLRQVTSEPQRLTSEVQLVCPEKIPDLPTTPVRKIANATVYGFSDNLPLTGKGIIIFPATKSGDITEYYGELKDGQFNGCGNYRHGNGDHYIGQFNNNSYHGKGKFIFENGCQYLGEFKKSLFDGQGTWLSKDGLAFSGTWHRSKLKGSNKNFTICK